QVVCAHQAHHSFMIHQHATPSQFCSDTAIAVAAPMLQHDLLNRRPHFHLFLLRLLLLQRAIETSPTYLGQVAHPFNTQAALQRHHFPDLVVDAFAPVTSCGWRRASIFCKAPLKKSTSRVFSAKARFSWLTSCRSLASPEFGGSPSPFSAGSS